MTAQFIFVIFLKSKTRFISFWLGCRQEWQK